MVRAASDALVHKLTSTDGCMRRDLMMSLVAVLSIPMAASAQAGAASKCAPDNAGLKLQAGFCASIFADTLRGAREPVIAPNGDVFLSSQGRGSGGILALRELNHSGRADVIQHFASGFTSAHVALFDGHLYAEATPPRTGGRGSPAPTISIVRYPLKAGELTPSGPADTIVTGLPGQPGHFTRNFVITRDGILYVNVGSATNSCQTKDRAKGSPGVNPCTELETRAGIWKFDARKRGQTQATGVHFARGIRNAVGIAISPLDGKLWTTQHGRDNLGGPSGNWEFDAKYNAENPAEELLQVNQGDDFGWPYCYYSVEEHHLVLAPEYGGDGKKVAQCAQKKEPVAVFPGHWAPNALFFYTGSAFPAKYKNGAFIAFHGSWNRSPEPAGGYNVIFQPLGNGKAAGPFEVFADGFSNATSGKNGNHRPSGLAQAPDGALYVTDDAGGRIYKIVYSGK
jgi:glucose/arabinose dehydrogenase